MDADLALALKLQEEFDRAENVACVESGPLSSTPGAPLSLADQSWEVMDPNPDIRALFLQYNDRFFWGRLAGIEVKWSPRMTLCAGLCVYEGRGGLCSVRLSLPLLKLRPRRDLVQTLLHEMIHAYLFVTDNNKDHDGHGPEFHKHMYRINKEAGVNITVYHTFHDEVAEYRQHWWRCNGPCQSRKPYFGYVKRAMNRAPGPRDPWFRDHQNSCNGTFIKVKEPENYGKKKKKGEGKSDKTSSKAVEQKSPNKDIRTFFGKGHVLSSRSPTKASPQKEVTKKPEVKGLPKFYDTDSDDELDLLAVHPQKNPAKTKNIDYDTSCDEKDLPEAILKDLLSDSEDELLCDALDSQEKLSSPSPSKTTNNDFSKSLGSKTVIDDSETSDLSDKASCSKPSTSKQSETPNNDVQNKLREIWGKKYENQSKNKTFNKTSIKRSLSKPQPATKRIKTDETIDLTSNTVYPKNTLTNDEKLLRHSSTETTSVVEMTRENPVKSSFNVIETDVCKCPVCSKDILSTHINQHLDACLGIT